MNKKTFSIFTIVILCMFIRSLHVSAGAATLQEKAEALNRITILKGDGVDFKLNDQMKRSEAATIIVRILGVENKVRENSNTYSITKFADVKSDQWYAPYVGYCANMGIISGDDSGNFNPNDYISEKAFLKLILGTLGYKVNIDYTWDKVFNKAYEIGIVTNEQYKTKSQDNVFYTRGLMVEAIYNSLVQKGKDTQKTIVQNLRDSGVVSQDILVSLGLINADIITTIDTVDTLDYNKIKIKLNEKITEFTEKNIEIYESDNRNNKLIVTIDSVINNEIVLTTSEQIPVRNYTIVIFNVKDYENNNINYLMSATFNGFKPEIVQTDFFRVSKVEAINNYQISVTFTHPININAFTPSLYQILEGNNLFINGSGKTISFNQSNSNTMIITLLDNMLKTDVEYWLKINGELISGFGTVLNESVGENIRFKGKVGVVEEFTVKKLYPTSVSTIYVEFSSELDPNMAKKIYYYALSEDNGASMEIIKSELLNTNDEDGKAVKLTLNGVLDQQKKYILTVNFMMDISHKESINEKKFPLVPTINVPENLKIEFAQALSSECVVLYFNKALNPQAASEPAYYFITGITDSSYNTQPVKGFYDSENNPKVVRLYLPKDKLLKESYVYNIRVLSAMSDSAGNYSTQDSDYKFSGVSTPAQSPRISEALIVGEDTLKLSFSEDIAAEAPNLLTSTYILEYSDTDGVITYQPTALNYINSKTIILKFIGLNYDKKYTLKYKSLVDSAGNSYSTGQGYVNTVEIKLGRK